MVLRTSQSRKRGATQSNSGSPSMQDQEEKTLAVNKPELSDELRKEIEQMVGDVPPLHQHFEIIDKIGSGTFSSVYLASLTMPGASEERFALKHILPISHPDRIENELRCLQDIGGFDNVMGVKACLRHRDHVVIVMPYFPHDAFQDYLWEMKPREVRDYMRQLLVAICRVHKSNVIHRDIKPSNFLFHRQTNQFALVDFGLAQDYTPSTSHPTSLTDCKTQEMKSPERTVSRKSMERCITPGNTQLKKRKFESGEPENTSESPRKKRCAASSKLAEIDTNVKQKQLANADKKSPKMCSTQLTNMFSTDKLKSPRRHVLTKNLQLLRPGPKTVVLGSGSKSVYKAVTATTCTCYALSQVCSICTARASQVAPRAGTPGFRAPEVLMKCPSQTTAVDMWSTGVIFLTLLSGRYPFFKSNDDMTALAQIISIFGTQEMRAAAMLYGKELIVSPPCEPADLQLLCQKLRGVEEPHPEAASDDAWRHVPHSAYALVKRLLDLNPATRISAETALLHEYFS